MVNPKEVGRQPRRNKDGTLHSDEIASLTKTTIDKNNLYVCAKEGSGKKTKGTILRWWAYRYTDAAGNRQWKKIANVGQKTPTEIRKIADDMDVTYRASGVDPRTYAPGGKKATLKEYALKQIEDVISKEVTPSEVKAWHRMLRKLGDLVDMPIASITRDQVKAAIMPIWLATPPTGRAIRQKLFRLLEDAKADGYRSGENPAQWEGGLKRLLPKYSKLHPAKKHHAAIPYQKAPALMTALRYDLSVIARCAEFTALTAVRSQDARGIRRSQVRDLDGDAPVWHAPKAIKKVPVAALIPLSRAAVTILKSMPNTGDLFFPSDHSKGHAPFQPNALSRVLQRSGVVAPEEITAHGLRSTFRDWAAETRAEEDFVLEFCINHLKNDDETIAAYRRTTVVERRRAVFEKWAAYVMSGVPAKAEPVSIPKPVPGIGGNVLHLPRRPAAVA